MGIPATGLPTPRKIPPKAHDDRLTSGTGRRQQVGPKAGAMLRNYCAPRAPNAQRVLITTRCNCTSVAWLLQKPANPILMTSLLLSIVPAFHRFNGRLVRGVFVLAAIGALSGSLLAQPPDTTPADPNAAANGRQRRGNQNGNAAGGRGNFDPAAMQEQMMARMREQFDVADDAEWTLISARITAVTELRLATAVGGLGGGFGGRGAGGPGGPGGAGGAGGRVGRQGATGNPEMTALRTALTDKLPDAEIKSRLESLRESRKQSAAKLEKAQEELRAVLSVRQEAVAVMAGLLP